MDSTVLPATLLAVSGAAVEQQAEVEALRARVAELERELAERTERANAAVAAAEDRLYWLDRWRIDPNRVMATRPGQWAFLVARHALRAARVPGRIRRRLSR
jgi:cell division septum initiation protein DivIVA